MKLPLIAASLLLSFSLQADHHEGKSLFNGKDLTGWKGRTDLWSVKDGAITGKTSADNPLKENTFLVWTNGVVGDFELHFKYKIQNGNSGVQYRSKLMDETKFVVGGYQGDFEAGTTYSGILYEERGRGILAARGEKSVIDEAGKKAVVGNTPKNSAELQSTIKQNDWNDYVIIAKGRHLIHKINGNVTMECTDNDQSKFVPKGILAIQVHAGPPMIVQLKDLHLKTLK